MPKKALSFAGTPSLVKAALSPPDGPPKININSTSITSSLSVLPVKTFVPSKKVVVPFNDTVNTSVARAPVKAAASKPRAFVV